MAKQKRMAKLHHSDFVLVTLFIYARMRVMKKLPGLTQSDIETIVGVLNEARALLHRVEPILYEKLGVKWMRWLERSDSEMMWLQMLLGALGPGRTEAPAKFWPKWAQKS